HLLGETLSPDGSRITLHQQDGCYCIRVNGAELMSTRHHASEELLAEVACKPLTAKPRARVLVGGLGFGYTLRAALGQLRLDARIVVAEILPQVVEWNRDPAYPLAADALRDKRVTVRQDAVEKILRNEAHGFDAILLDVDNGPAAFTTRGNNALYGAQGLQ